jgi:hypothetical protein
LTVILHVGKLPLATVAFAGMAKLHRLRSGPIMRSKGRKTHNPELMPVDPLNIAFVQGEANVLWVVDCSRSSGKNKGDHAEKAGLTWFLARNSKLIVSPTAAVTFEGLKASMPPSPTVTVWLAPRTAAGTAARARAVEKKRIVATRQIRREGGKECKGLTQGRKKCEKSLWKTLRSVVNMPMQLETTGRTPLAEWVEGVE